MFYQSQIKLFSQNLHLIKQQLLQLNIGIHDGDIMAYDMECDKLDQCVFCFVLFLSLDLQIHKLQAEYWNLVWQCKCTEGELVFLILLRLTTLNSFRIAVVLNVFLGLRFNFSPSFCIFGQFFWCMIRNS